MPQPSALEKLLRELERGSVVAASYSRKSAYFRVEPMLRATVLALLAIFAGVALGFPRGADTAAHRHG